MRSLDTYENEQGDVRGELRARVHLSDRGDGAKNFSCERNARTNWDPEENPPEHEDEANNATPNVVWSADVSGWTIINKWV